MSAIPAPVLADLIPGRTLALPVRALRTAALVLGGTAFLAIASQVAVPLPFTPVPVSLATGAVVLLGAGLGPRLGTASALLYLIAGMAGAPIFAEQGFGWAFASFGYVIGYVPAAYIAGVLARRAADRSVWKTAALAGASTIAAYVVRSEERRVGKESRCQCMPQQSKDNIGSQLVIERQLWMRTALIS